MPARATELATSNGASPARAKSVTASKDRPPARARALPTSTEPTPARADLDTIKTLGALLDDLEKVRIMNGNRIGALEREYGESLPHLDVIQKQVAAAEHLAHLELVRAWRRHPLASWAKEYHGLGEKSIARLVAIIGDPAERPNVAKLWAYCGHGNPARKRAKGMSQEELFKLGNPRAKKQVWLIATALVKAGVRKVYDDEGEVVGREALSPMGAVYLAARYGKYADALHESPCVRCGPAGHPAAAGSPLSNGHKHARALRKVGKDFLRDLWIASRQVRVDAQSAGAGGDS